MRIARLVHAITAVVAAVGVALGFGIAIAGAYATEGPIDPGLFDAGGPQSLAGRVADHASYFTIWSNVIVVVVFAILALRPARDGRLLRVLLFDALLMILVTGIVYNAVIAPANPTPTGLAFVATTLEHVVTPLLALGAWLAVGPRGWLRRGLIAPTLIIPIAWIALTLIRGAIIDAYPYGFIDVVTLGYGRALVNILVIVLLGILLAIVLIGLDRLAGRWTRTPAG